MERTAERLTRSSCSCCCAVTSTGLDTKVQPRQPCPSSTADLGSACSRNLAPALDKQGSYALSHGSKRVRVHGNFGAVRKASTAKLERLVGTVWTMLPMFQGKAREGRVRRIPRDMSALPCQDHPRFMSMLSESYDDPCTAGGVNTILHAAWDVGRAPCRGESVKAPPSGGHGTSCTHEDETLAEFFITSPGFILGAYATEHPPAHLKGSTCL